MLEDKLKMTDWEATDYQLEQQTRQESYLQWLQEQNDSTKGKQHRRKLSNNSNSVCFYFYEAFEQNKIILNSLRKVRTMENFRAVQNVKGATL